MKIVINYDLVNEIFQANTGINLKRVAGKMELYMGIIAALDLTEFVATQKINPMSIVSGIIYGTIVFGGSEFATKGFNKSAAENRLRNLASSLSKINIYTDTDSIKNAHLYKTQYKLVRDDKTAIQQNKYIMLPTTGTLNADEVSLLQEHIIGSGEYALSIGEPKKADSKVLYRALAR